MRKGQRLHHEGHEEHEVDNKNNETNQHKIGLSISYFFILSCMIQLGDYLYDELKSVKGIELSLDQMDSVLDKVMQVAKHRSYKWWNL